jgi:N-dimethylarginine dimethylaminohydrolase
MKPGSSTKPHLLMSPPDFFEVVYAINPWMTATVDRDQAMRQWDALHQTLTGPAGARVSLIPPVQNLPDLVFTANAAFVHGNKAVIARYKHPERQPEEPHAERWFREQGFDVCLLPREMNFEGAGDALTYADQFVVAGYKQRTDIEAHQALSRETGLPVLSVELIQSRFYHIDVCLCPLTGGHLIYYPGAFDHYGLQVIETNVPEHLRLPVTAEEAGRFCCNAVNVGDTVVLNQGSAILVAELRRRNFQVLEVDLSEFIKAGGSAKCLTLRVG